MGGFRAAAGLFWLWWPLGFRVHHRVWLPSCYDQDGSPVSERCRWNHLWSLDVTETEVYYQKGRIVTNLPKYRNLIVLLKIFSLFFYNAMIPRNECFVSPSSQIFCASVQKAMLGSSRWNKAHDLERKLGPWKQASVM